jgi:hypothetical protein
VKTYEYAGDPFTEPRSHPWVDKVGSPDSRYYDLTANPGLIRTSLEDFRPWNGHAAIETVYALLESLNQRGSVLESNDCAFEGPTANLNRGVPKAFECSGRIMVLFRELERNTQQESVAWLKNELHYTLADQEPDFHWGVVGTTIVPVRFLALPDSDERQLGQQLMISFWAWGDSDADTMLNLERVLKSVAHALRTVSELSR